LSLSGMVRAKDGVRVGKLLRADWLLVGSPLTLNDNNLAVLRIVDARTGIMLNGTVLLLNKNGSPELTDVSSFVRRSRKDASAASERVYLAIGGFDDLSINNRQADFPSRLRTFLTGAYQNTNVTLLER